MFRVTPPHGIPVVELFISLEDAMWEMRYHMLIPTHSWQIALEREEQGETRFHFGCADRVGRIEAVLH